MKQVYLGLGTNIGDRHANLEKALNLLGKRLEIVKASSVYETEPVGYKDQPKFLNAVCLAQTSLGPLQLLSLVKGIEASMGREAGFRNGPRSIDIDIILYSDMSMIDSELTIPHPRMNERAFVLIPLMEIAPADLIHPFTKERLAELAAMVGGREGVKKVGKLEVKDV
jgi:2-amino-4-hydroxy-6-hydroxymethyldihydropteridine diphosphokinase